MKSTWEAFSIMLNERLHKDIFTTEDSIRYTFYLAAIEELNLKHYDIILEHHHHTIPNAQVDAIVNNINYNFGVEFKYDRKNKGGTNQNRTQRAGNFLNDIFRLGAISKTKLKHKYFIYTTDEEMHSYFINPINNLKTIYDLELGATFAIKDGFLASYPKSLTNAIHVHPPCTATSLYKKEIAKKHHLRIFEIAT